MAITLFLKRESVLDIMERHNRSLYGEIEEYKLL